MGYLLAYGRFTDVKIESGEDWNSQKKAKYEFILIDITMTRH